MKNIFKILKLFISLIIVCMLFACENGISEKYDYKIALIPDTAGVNDQSFSQITWEGLQKFGKDHENVKVSYIESKVDSDFLVNAQILIDSDYDLIIGCGYPLKDCIFEAASENPNKKFVLIDDVIDNLDNVINATFNMEEASYLVGVVAAYQSKNKNVGLILANNSKLLTSFGVGFIEGVKSVNKNIIVQQNNINSFSDATLAKVVATSMITSGADIIYTAAGSAGPGAVSACGENGKLAIGVDIDQSFIDPKHVLTSAVKRLDLAIYDICEDFINGKFVSGERKFNLENGGVGIVKNSKLLSKEILDKIEKVEKDIKDKKIIVHSEAKDCPDFELAN